MIIHRLAVLSTLITLLSACNGPLDTQFAARGIGTELYYDKLSRATDLQDVYVAHICRQSGFSETIDGRVRLCADWTTFVQAGLNDIDQRCDAYLSWIDERRRSREPILQQISDLRTATTAILSVAGVGVEPIAIASAIFGLSSSTFTNLNSRLLLELENSTVEAVVISRRVTFRKQLQGIIFDNRPAAIHALQAYLRICMPYTIEGEINSSIIAYERGGLGALGDHRTRTNFVPQRPSPPENRRRSRGELRVVKGLASECATGDDTCVTLSRFLDPSGRGINSERLSILRSLASKIKPELSNEVLRIIADPQSEDRQQLLVLLRAEQPSLLP